jgi:Nuclease-related domain
LDELGKLSPTAWLLIGCAAALGFGVSWAWRWYRRYRARKARRTAVIGASVDHIANCLVPDGAEGGFHVDFLLLTAQGVVVIDLRDIRGNIFGGDQMAEWTVMDGARRFTFTNPQSALYDRIAAVKALVGEAPVEGRILFTHRSTFPKGLPKWTLMLDAMRGEFPAAEAEGSPAAAPYAEAWGRLKAAVKPSYMVDMR